ncbi:hypothetical protein RDWZM_010102 [Blomia tropicalis]|uniref:Ubiquitin-like modifier-activating enzyme ATG7 n=1 Tax=Blomia tropicalis TaxID=40697 RepID=A0A9Q0LYJ1_BLOTA|nr:hypothetical protein RDWZM_010102 [Blomia tropicalis]
MAEVTPPKRILLQFATFSSMIDPSFWHSLSKLKLNQIGLDESPIDVSVTFHSELNLSLPCFANIDFNSFMTYDSIKSMRLSKPTDDNHYMFGQLIIFNTMERFAKEDKRNLIIEHGKIIWNSILSDDLKSTVDSNLEQYLSRFLMITFPNLKRYTNTYWCAFPALNFPSRCFQYGHTADELESHFTDSQLLTILYEFCRLPPSDRLYYVIIRRTEMDSSETVTVKSYNEFWSYENIDLLKTARQYKVYFAFSDPSPTSSYPGWPLRNYIAYIYVRMAQLFKRSDYHDYNHIVRFIFNSLFSPVMNIFSSRIRYTQLSGLSTNPDSIVQSYRSQSSIFRIIFGKETSVTNQDGFLSTMPHDEASLDMDRLKNDLKSFFSQTYELIENGTIPPIVGWERSPENDNRLLPRTVDCSQQMDPAVIAHDAIHLNLKLMKWRLVPKIDLDLIHNTRCLLFGAGTLGCNVARSLMAWGVSTITFVDNGQISYSNPVRQTLFTHEDSIPVDGKPKMKAQIAANALKLINPSVQSEGIVLSVPMPGHSVELYRQEEVEKDFERIKQLIQSHDVIFLLMDTRESRWLPTLIAASMHKTIINVALGFDTYLVQRHGIRFRPDNEYDLNSEVYKRNQTNFDQLPQLKTESDTSSIQLLLGNELGCYYCNDIFAPGNSTLDRTLDQQCTVTRPGLSMIASGYAVEMFASLLQHSLQSLAPAISNVDDERDAFALGGYSVGSNSILEIDSILGTIPHHIRGFVSRSKQITPSLRAFDNCTACSFPVIDRFRSDGFRFIIQVLDDSAILEDVAGLKRFHDVDELEEFE